MAGRRLGKYDLVEEIGRGAMGEVYRGVDRSSGREVAVKVLAPQLAADSDLVKRFEREARATARLEHPGIVKGYDLGAEEGTHYFAMQLVAGESLEEVFFDRGRLEPSEVAALGIQVAQALSYAHGEGLVHRDIKPGNLLIDPSGNCLLTDFGIALAAVDTRLTRVGESLGSPHYLAPELVGGGEPDARSDLYSLGVVLFQALTGELPYPGANALAVLRELLEAPLRRTREVDASVPEEMDRVIAKLMAQSPEERYQGGAEVAGDLLRWSGGETPSLSSSGVGERGSNPPVATPAPASVEPRAVARRRYPVRIVLGLLLLALAIALARYLGC